MLNKNKVLGKNAIAPDNPVGFKFDLIKNSNKKFFII